MSRHAGGPGVLVIGVGNTHRQDDGAGLYVAHLVREMSEGKIEVREESGDLLGMLDAWHAAGTVFVIDAVAGSAEAGTVHRFEGAGSLPRNFFRCSTHDFGVGEVIELGRVLGNLPERVLVYGIEGASFDMGEGLTEAVERAAREVAHEVLQSAALDERTRDA